MIGARCGRCGGGQLAVVYIQDTTELEWTARVAQIRNVSLQPVFAHCGDNNGDNNDPPPPASTKLLEGGTTEPRGLSRHLWFMSHPTAS